jgi:hypothetical protein
MNSTKSGGGVKYTHVIGSCGSADQHVIKITDDVLYVKKLEGCCNSTTVREMFFTTCISFFCVADFLFLSTDQRIGASQ